MWNPLEGLTGVVVSTSVPAAPTVATNGEEKVRKGEKMRMTGGVSLSLGERGKGLGGVAGLGCGAVLGQLKELRVLVGLRPRG
jgi:hypothetical protein